MAVLQRARHSRPGRVRAERLRLADGAVTTVHVAEHDAERTEVRVAVLRGHGRLVPWCAERGVEEAIVGGFFTRAPALPLGEVRTRGVPRRSVPVVAPWDAVRSCLHVVAGRPHIARRDRLPAIPRGDLLQAGPLLVRDGRPVIDPVADPEGFSAAAHQFDSDITVGRHPRAALGLAPGRVVAVACDGRAHDEAGLTLVELAAVMAGLGCHDALNLDGGGSTTLVSGGELCNIPRGSWESPEVGGRPVATAVLFLPRA